MTALLAIVKTVPEADAALQAGADRVAIAVGDEANLGRTLYDLGERGDLDESLIGLMLGTTTRSRIESAGLLSTTRIAELSAIWLPFPPEQSPLGPAAASKKPSVIGVVSADVPVDEPLCAEAKVAGLSGLLLSEGPFAPTRLLDRRSIAQLSGIVTLCRKHSLSVAFAGAVEQPDIPRLLACGPDELGIDLALLGDSGVLEPERLVAMKRLFARENRGGTSPVHSGSVPDRIFVHNYTVAMSIGAYERERAALQRVRFSVDVELAPAPPRATGMGSVVSYDLVTDAIGRLAQAHVEFVETVAEDLAGAVLAHPRTLAVEITVEKLDVGPGSVGCRIVRQRS